MGEDGRTMTDLISRPARSSGGRGAARGPSAPEERAPKPASAGAALGGAVAAGTTLVICMSLALTGWFLADGGAHGRTTDALRVGADGWLAGHGSRVVLAGTPLGLAPLTLTVILL